MFEQKMLFCYQDHPWLSFETVWMQIRPNKMMVILNVVFENFQFWKKNQQTAKNFGKIIQNASAVRNESDCRSRGHDFDPGLVQYFSAEWNYFYSHSPSSDSRRVVVSYNRKYVHEVLVNCLVKLAQEKVWIGELTVSTWPKLLPET